MQLQGHQGTAISLFTMHYLDGNPARGKVIPRLIGFQNPVEREFFDLFCSVDGVGIRTALRALVRPVEDIARMIEEQDAKGLSALPGIGGATAERIIAKLRRKVPKFALLITKTADPESARQRDVFAEAFEVLRTLRARRSGRPATAGAAGTVRKAVLGRGQDHPRGLRSESSLLIPARLSCHRICPVAVAEATSPSARWRAGIKRVRTAKNWGSCSRRARQFHGLATVATQD